MEGDRRRDAAELGEELGIGDGAHGPEDAGFVEGEVVDVGQEGVLTDLADHERGGLSLILRDLVPCYAPIKHWVLRDEVRVEDLEEAGTDGRGSGEDRGRLREDGGALDGRPQLLVKVVAEEGVAGVNGPPGGAELVVVGLELADPALDCGRCGPVNELGRLQGLSVPCRVGGPGGWVASGSGGSSSGGGSGSGRSGVGSFSS